MSDPAARIVGLYDDRAEVWVTDRGRALGRGGPVLDEAMALDRFVEILPPGARVLDVGCGSGWPISAALLESGFEVTGLDSSPSLLTHARDTLSGGTWVEGDMRTMGLDRRFDGVIAWNSLFHLTAEDQRIALERMVDHAADRSAMLFTAGPAAGEAIGEWQGELLYHASLDPAEYLAILEAAGFTVEMTRVPDPDGLGSTVWLARRAFLSAE